jgi:hypothetical protein
MAARDHSRASPQPLTSETARSLLRSLETGFGAPPAPGQPTPMPIAVPATQLPASPPYARQMQAPPGIGPIGAMHQPGGQWLANLLHDSVGVQEWENRVLPDDSWYDPGVNPANPVQFEIFAYKVPSQMHLWIYDYEFSIFRLSGLEAGDIVQAEPGRFSSNMGFDITVNGVRHADLKFQLDPQATAVTRQSFNTQGTPSGPTPTAAQFSAGTSASFASTASSGQSLLPVRRKVQGPEGQPWTMIARQGETVALSCVIFRRVRSPIAAVSARLAGYLLQSNLSTSLLERMRPR